MTTNDMILSAVKNMAAMIGGILGAPGIDTTVVVNGEKILDEKV